MKSFNATGVQLVLLSKSANDHRVAMTSNVIRFPRAKQVTSVDRLAARRAYRRGIDQLAIKAIENAFVESANIPGVEDILLKDAQLLFVASMRRALIRVLEPDT